MIRSRLGLKALVLSGLVLGMMAFATSGAQAEELAKWRVSGADVGALAPQLVIKEIENKSASLAFTTKGGTGVLILCTTAAFSEGGKLLGKGTISLGDITFNGCVVLLNEAPAANCKPHSPGKPVGEILTGKGKGLIMLDVGNDLVKITPETAAGAATKLFVTIELGELCAIGESVNVEATELGEGLWIKDIGGNAGFLAETTTHLIVEGLNKLLALGQPAKIIGSAIVELGGPHAGLKWSGVPG
jgi:hypothetical protein